MATSEKNLKTNNNEKKNTEVNKTKPNKVFMIVFVIGMIILLAIYLFNWLKVRDDEDITNSYLLQSNTTNLKLKDLDDVSQVLAEAPHEYFVLISYTNDENTHAMEKSFKKLIDKYKLNDSFYYFDAKELKENDDYINLLNKTFKTNKIKKIPVILYIKDNKVIDIVARHDNNMINNGDFQKLLDVYDFKSQ